MNRYLLAVLIEIICLAGRSRLSFSQERSFAPYFGANWAVGSSGPGWGIELGTRLNFLYAGLEYGIAYPWPVAVNYDPVPGSVAPPWPASNEQFLGIHAGYFFNESYYLGIVLLGSLQTWNSWDTSRGYAHAVRDSYTRTFLNVGPDFRYSGFIQGHMYLDCAFTIRRGLKAGLGYMF